MTTSAPAREDEGVLSSEAAGAARDERDAAREVDLENIGA